VEESPSPDVFKHPVLVTHAHSKQQLLMWLPRLPALEAQPLQPQHLCNSSSSSMAGFVSEADGLFWPPNTAAANTQHCCF
jgi:hypothetical protein